MARRDRVREELGWLKVLVVLTVTGTASIAAWIFTDSPVATMPVFVTALPWLVASSGLGLTLGILQRTYHLLAECEREE